MLRLPGVTLALRDALCPELARLALLDTLALIKPDQTLIFSPVNLNVPGTWIKTKPWASHREHCKFFWHTFPYYIKTPMVLSIEWDGFVLDPDQWSEEFMQFDYIGAPWWYDDGLNVGNGSGLRSKGLMDFLERHEDVFPVREKEDELLSRIYRPTLEQHGFRWPTEQVASKFSFECTRPSVDSKHFMFHDSFNFPAVLDGYRLEERISLMKANPYLQKGHKIKELEQGRKAMILDRLA
jgi:hypothetical protein